MGNDLPICVQCGVQYPQPRETCSICDEERQFVRWDGQLWTSLDEMRAGEHRCRIEDEGPGITGIGSEPSFAIGQRALLVRAASGNVLWDCIPYLDDEVVARVEELGGLTAIAISHPHYYSTMVDWAQTFDVPVYVHAADRQWVPRRDDHVVFWEGGTREIADGLTLVNLGVHFTGGSVLHWRDGEAGAGALLSGDIVQVVADRRWVSFMYSYPNLIPERPAVIRRAVDLLRPYRFERIYGAWWRRIVDSDAEAVVRRSAERYLRMVAEE
ncbi:MBL fold metallo-hydrolase [Saccharopolyspora rosea]|uniref:MBL fold metallo-hydrolase n=1 Tax=Saccharopolyspora rosea TaxID=524884 RepID=A0ABW3G115_9PSEU|nr:MBL fold metallo-hydrolase [Saccharopolyspora rosea]